MANLPNIHNSPVAVLKALDAYSRGEGSLYTIADALHLEPSRFDRLMSWYLLNLCHPFEDDAPSFQTLLNLILLHLLEKTRLDNMRLAKEITAIHKKIKRLHTPVRE